MKFFGKTGRNWTQHTLARGVDGSPIWYENPKAVAFCALGACYKMEIANKDLTAWDFVDINDNSKNFLSFRNKLERIAAKA